MESSTRYKSTQLRALRTAAWLEGIALILLIFVAVPIKHFANFPQAVSFMGPVHGLFIVLYIWTVINAAASGAWSKPDAILATIAAFIPFGVIFNVAFMHPKLQILEPLSNAKS